MYQEKEAKVATQKAINTPSGVKEQVVNVKKNGQRKKQDSPEEVLKLLQTGTRADKRSPRESASAGHRYEAATSLPP